MQILADYRAEIQKHEFQADYDRRNFRKLSETIESQQEEICRAHQGDERRRQDQELLHEQLLEQNRDLREAHMKSLNDMEELKRFQDSTFDTIEDRDTIRELTGMIQELQNEINCMNDSRDFQDAESVRSGQSHVTSQPVFFPPHPDAGVMLSRSLECRAATMGRQVYLGHAWFFGNVFCRSRCVFDSTFSAGIESMEF